MKWLILISLIIANFVEQPSPIIKTPQGLIRGRVSTDGEFFEYLSLPYATTTPETRFQAPLPPPAWEGIYEANNENIRCPQRMIGSLILGELDCLKLNVYSPIYTKDEKPLPVMVYIHGGCFFEGNGSPFLYGPDFFLKHEIVFVGVNYRLNVEGFLCLGIKNAPGNAGIKDQIAALRWIQKNIRAFGGDPDNVTLFGESAGAVSTSLLMLSPLSKGLFHKGILQSGSTFAPWALQHQPIETASALAKVLGYHTKDPHQLYNIFMNTSYEKLILARASTYRSFSITAEILFSPCVEKEIPGIDAVITDTPMNMISSGHFAKIPIIVGFNDKEGIYFVGQDYGTKLKELTITETLQPDLEFSSDINKTEIGSKLLQHYFSGEVKDKILNLVDLYSDLHFKFPSILEAEMMSKVSSQPLYYYLFKYDGTINMAKYVALFRGTQGSSHADELFYMFKPHSFPLPHRFLEYNIIQRMITMWTNFAKYGDPTPVLSTLLPVKWKPSSFPDLRGLVIDEEMKMSLLPDRAVIRLWNETYTRYRRKNYGFNT